MGLVTRSGVARLFVILGVLALALGAVLSIPRGAADLKSAPVAVALVDVSKSSVARGGRDWAQDTTAAVKSFVASAETRGHDIAIVAFGRDVRVVLSPRSPREVLAEWNANAAEAWLEPGARGGAARTRLLSACTWVQSLAAERVVAAVAIFGDGTFTGPDPGASLTDLALRGVVLTLEPPPRRVANLALAPLVVPRELEVGAPIVVSTAVRFDAGTLQGPAAWVEFTVHDAQGARTRRVDCPSRFATGGRVDALPIHVDLGPARAGSVRIEAVLGRADGSSDAVPEDDRSEALLRCHGTLVVGWMPAPDLALEPWRIEGVEIVPLTASELARRLPTLDALVTLDARLDLEAETLIASAVRSGAGWLDLARWNWIRSRQDLARPLSALGALVPDRGSQRPRDVLFLIDASGSMAGEPFDVVREKIGDLVDAAPPTDDLVVRFFAEDLGPPIRFGKASDRGDPQRRAEAIAAVRNVRAARGATRILRALEQITAERVGSERDLLVLLLSDGRDQEAREGAARFEALKRARAGVRMRIAAVAPVADVDREYLKRVADDVADLADPARWPEVFEEELREHDLVRRSETPFSVLAVADGSEPTASLARATAGAPGLLAAARTEVAPDAQVLWTDERGAPLAAFARREAGGVVSIAFTPGTSWAPAWRDASVLAPLVRALARSERSRRPHARIEDERIVLENVDERFAAVAPARVLTAEGESIAFELFADARGYDALTTRSAPLPTDLDTLAGSTLLHVEGAGAAALDLPLELPRRGEFAFEPRTVRLRAAEPARAPAPAASSTHPLAPWSLLLGVLMLSVAAFLGAFTGRGR